MTEAVPLSVLADDIAKRARKAFGQGMAMRDASALLIATHEFDQWATVFQNGSKELTRADVVRFFTAYAKAIVDAEVDKSSASPQSQLFDAPSG